MLRLVNVTREQGLTPKAQKYYRVIKNLRSVTKKLFTNNSELKDKLKEANDFVNSEDFIKATVNETTFSFILSQVKQQRKHKKGRRFTVDDKIFALSLYKQSPRGYRYLQKVFALPSKSTINKVLALVPMETGINTTIFKCLEDSVKSMAKETKVCVLMFDEIFLDAGLTYSSIQDRLIGFHDLGESRKQTFANHAMVYMVKGVFKSWKQPVCYYLTDGGLKATDLASEIIKVISKCQEIGLKVVATVCDQLSVNSSAIKILKQKTDESFIRKGEENRLMGFLVNDQEIVPLFDSPHLLKGIRNNLLEHDAIFCWKNGQQKASWTDVVNLYVLDESELDLKMCHKLTDVHVYKDKMKKMKVNVAAQVFSQNVSGVMRGLIKHGMLTKPYKFLQYFNFATFTLLKVFEAFDNILLILLILD